MHRTLYDQIYCRPLAPVVLVFSYLFTSTNIKQSLVSTLSFSNSSNILFGLPHFVSVYLAPKDLSVAVCDKSLWKQLYWIYWKSVPDIIFGTDRGHF